VVPLRTPSEFYHTLLHGCRSATRRVGLASLYLGTGALEQELVRVLAQRAQDSHRAGRQIEVNLQMDYGRALRKVHKASAAAAGAAEEAGAAAAYQSSCHLLVDLLCQCPDPTRSHVGLSLLPQVRESLAGRLLPPRFVEGMGVFHLKAYCFDDDVLLSGANLSADYFTNRQDRYLLIRGNKALADYMHGLLRDLRTLPGGHVLLASGQVATNGADGLPLQVTPPTEPASASAANRSVCLNASVAPLPYTAADTLPPLPPRELGSLNRMYSDAMASLITRYSVAAAFAPTKPEAPSSDPPHSHRRHSHHKGGCGDHGACWGSEFPPATDRVAWVSPRLQLGTLDRTFDEDRTLRLLASLGNCAAAGIGRDVAHVATGYFNLTDRYMHALIRQAGKDNSTVHILTAAPEANGFFGSAGFSGGIPMAYNLIERKFFKAVAQAERLHPSPSHPDAQEAVPGVGLFEYHPGAAGADRWTFHGKGMWVRRLLAAAPAPATGATSEKTSSCPEQEKGLKEIETERGFITLVGSPNFGRRSAERDLELQVEIRTSDPALSWRLRAERDALFGWDIDRESSREALASSGQHPAVVVAAKEAHEKVPHHAAPYVTAVGPHLGPEADVWSRPARVMYGMSWHRGLWIGVAAKVLSGFF
jgi:CDP-diacylglycerol--glycerol-3-phosphate 3-phosphatidyltransferase